MLNEIDDQLEIKLKSAKLAKNVYLSFNGDDGFFSDNYFNLLPNREIVIVYTPTTSDRKFLKNLTIKFLRDTYIE
ncbi:MAG: hypothetical protein KKG93_02520 [Bacteroidetes bacterium]|nr:hypothetical protein [Bacteroidota bacterium]